MRDVPCDWGFASVIRSMEKSFPRDGGSPSDNFFGKTSRYSCTSALMSLYIHGSSGLSGGLRAVSKICAVLFFNITALTEISGSEGCTAFVVSDS